MPAAGNDTPPGAALKKTKKRKPTVVKAPAGDVASSGGDYGTKQAKKAAKSPRVQRDVKAVYAAQPLKQKQAILKHATGPVGAAVRDVHEARRQRAEDIAHAQAEHDIITAKDLQVAQAFNEAHPVKHEGLTIDTGTPEGRDLLKKGRKNLAKAQAGGALGELSGLNVKKALDNVPSDALELAVTTPSSVAKLASTAVTHPKKVPGMLAAQYKELIKDPKGFIENKPVSAALMVSPVARAPGLIAGKAARLAGKQSLARPTATLPGTALKEARTGSRDFTVRRVQEQADKNPGGISRKLARGASALPRVPGRDAVVSTLQKRAVDRKAAAGRMTDAQIQKRADEFFDVGQQHKQRVVRSATKEAKRRYANLPKAERQVAGEEHVSGARGGAREQVDKKFAEKFGATYTRTPEGVVLKPKQASKGVLHDNKADADLIAERVPFDASVKQVGEKYAVVPKVAVERLNRHNTVGTSPAIGAKVMRTAGKSFRGAVLPFSFKWLTGQGVEAGIRSAVAGAGPMSFLREHRNFKVMEAQKPGSGVEFRQTTSSGGQFGLTGTAREFADGKRTLAEEFEGTGLGKPAKALTKAGAVPPVKLVRRGFHAYSRFVFDGVNGAIETTAQRAMTGKAIKQGPLMESKLLGLTNKAIEDAARGLQHTENQIAAGRAVQRMYGSYSKFSPEKRETLLHTTPFYPWYRNVVTFITKTLPVDHPVKTALLADLDAATEEWRKANGLSLRGGKTRPGFLLGGYPTAGGGITRVGRYTPAVPGDPVGAAADLALPQFSGIRDNLIGIDFTGKKIKGNRLLNAGATALETHVPGVAQVGRVTGLTGRYVRKKDEPSVLQGKDLKAALLKEINPLVSTGGGSSSDAGPATKVKPVRVKPVRVKPVRVKPIR